MIFAGVALSVDVDLKESEKAFEAEFHKKYANKEDEKRAGNFSVFSIRRYCVIYI